MPDSKDRKEATGPGVASTDRGMEQMKDGKDSPHPDLDAEEAAHVEERSTGSAKVVHEVVRLQGEEELDRPILALMLSGLAAGLAITLSLMSELFLRARLPDTDWAPLIYLLGYPVGYLIVIMGRLQLFTESTVTAVLPVATVRALAIWAVWCACGPACWRGILSASRS